MPILIIDPMGSDNGQPRNCHTRYLLAYTLIELTPFQHGVSVEYSAQGVLGLDPKSDSEKQKVGLVNLSPYL